MCPSAFLTQKVLSYNLLIHLKVSYLQSTERKMKKSILLSFAIIVFTGMLSLLNATPPPLDPVVLPIDGGLSVLIAICSGYGIRKIYKYNKVEENI